MFQMTNEKRKYLGLTYVLEHWEKIVIDNMILYFDNDIIKKVIDISEEYYFERDLNIKTIENRTILLPKTEKGKPKKLNTTGILSFNPFGIAFTFSNRIICIFNASTGRDYYLKRFPANEENQDTLEIWIDNWIRESTENDLLEIESFKNVKRKRSKYKEGDFFAFKIDRRNYAFGRILVDLSKRETKDYLKKNKNYGLTSFMGKTLIVKVYHKISSSIDVDLDELSSLNALPSHAVMADEIITGEKFIIGNKSLKMEEYDMLISCCKTDYDGKIYLQYGFIFKEIDISNFGEYLNLEAKYSNGGLSEDPFRKEYLNFYLDLDVKILQKCISDKSNKPYWEQNIYNTMTDLRNPSNFGIKNKVFKAFGLDANKSYEQNLIQFNNASR